MNNKDELKHYGVLGMHWGKRKGLDRIGDDNELKHYGVLGMHWGNRHSYYKGTTNPHYMRKVAKQEHKIEKIYNKADQLTNKINKKRHGLIFSHNTRKLDKRLNNEILSADKLGRKMTKQYAKKEQRLSKNEQAHVNAIHSKAHSYLDSLSKVKTSDLILQLNSLTKTKAKAKNRAIQKTYENLQK